MEASHSGMRPWRTASNAAANSGQWKPSMSEYRCTRVNGGRYSSHNKYVATAAKMAMVRFRNIGFPAGALAILTAWHAGYNRVSRPQIILKESHGIETYRYSHRRR